jgi:16S rRNA (cytosine1402-N4)-methyltransferase
MSTNHKDGSDTIVGSPDQSNQLHIPVLLEQVLQYLNPQAGDSYLDLTAGYGGHAQKILELTTAGDANAGEVVLVDRDSNAIHHLEKVFANQPVHIMHSDFLGASQTLQSQGKRFDLILADLGVSSPHLNQESRGFAIAADGPLDMRMDQTQDLTAATIVNTYPSEDIADILKRYGEEPKAHIIAKKIVEYRKDRPFTSTTQLAEVVARAWPGHSRVHPATRSFQALRIAVNDELRLIEEGLPIWIELLQPGGRLVVISFHSLEDRLVKQAFAEAGGDRFDATVQVLTKQPVMAEASEIVSNPRARSAKLRAAVKTKNR